MFPHIDMQTRHKQRVKVHTSYFERTVQIPQLVKGFDGQAHNIKLKQQQIGPLFLRAMY